MAGGRAANLVVKILVDNAGARDKLDETATGFDRFESSMGRLARPAGIVVGALAGLGVAAVSSASRTEQAMGALDSVFGSNADTVKGWAADAAQSVGLAQSEYGELASVLGAQLQNLGLDTDAATGGTQELIGLGADLAATFGGSTADAVNALSAALRGEADPAERYGLSLNQTAINSYLAANGLDHLTGEARTAARAQAVMAMAADQSGGAVGQFAREADTAAGQQQRMAAEIENARSELGEHLLPIVSAVTQKLADMANWVGQNSTLVLTLAGVLGGLAVGILAINGALAIYRAVQTAATAVTWAMNAAWLASPITWIVVGIAAIVAGIILLWRNCEGFRKVVTKVWQAMKTGAVVAWNAIKRAISAVITWAKSFISGAGRTVSNVWKSIRSAASTAFNGVRSVVSSVIGRVRSIISGAGGAARGVWASIRSAASTAFNGVRSVVSSVIGSIRSTVNNVRSVFTAVWNVVRSGASSAFSTLRSVASSALNAVLSPVRALQSAFNTVVGAVRSLISWIGRIRIPEINLPFGLGSRSAPAARSLIASAGSGAPSPLLLADARAGARGSLLDALGGLRGPQLNGGGLTVVNVSGTLNDTDSARAVRRVLRNDSRRRGGVVIGAA